MTLRKTLAGLALALGVSFGAGAASAVTVDFTGGPNGPSLDFGDFTVTAQVGPFGAPANVTHNGAGLGVRSGLDLSGQIDSILFYEQLTFTFDETVVVNSLSFSGLGSSDEYSIFVDGAFVLAGVSDDPLLGPATLDSFSIRAQKESLFDVDSFRISSIDYDIAPVPLPAAGWMLLAGLGGIYAMKRRKTA